MDQEFAGTAITSGIFPAFPTFRSFTNVKTLNLLYQYPLYLLPSAISSSEAITLDTGTNTDNGQGAMCSISYISPEASRSRNTSPRIMMVGGYISDCRGFYQIQCLCTMSALVELPALPAYLVRPCEQCRRRR